MAACAGCVGAACPLLSEEEALHEPDEAHQGDGARRGLDRASLPARAPHPDEDRQEQGDHERLTGFHAEVALAALGSRVLFRSRSDSAS